MSDLTILTKDFYGTKILKVTFDMEFDDGHVEQRTFELDQVAFATRDGKFGCEGVLLGHHSNDVHVGPKMKVGPKTKEEP